MTLEEAQHQVDCWIKKYGVRYFSELTNMAVLTEEVGELARVMSRKYGDQSFKEGEKDKICILTATSGDTGKAALEGYAGVEGTEIIVFYPQHGVSQVQERQMDSQEGDNTHVIAIRGNYDDAQTGVKKIFADDITASELAA